MPIPNLTNSGSMPIKGGDANAGSGDSIYNNHTRFAGVTYNKGIPTWVIAAGIAVVAVWVVSRARS